MVHILIAETGAPPAPLGQTYGDYGAMTDDMLASFGTATLEIVRVWDGERLPAAQSETGLVITGSPAGVYEDHDWIPPLEDAVRDWANAGGPMVGICFGHQLIAQALGGKVVKSDKGWGVGVHTYDLAVDAAPWGDSPRRFSCVVSHQDQVVALPKGAVRVAGSPFCLNGVVHYPDAGALTFQMHPEFETEFAQALLRTRLSLMPEEVSALAQATYRGETDRTLMAGWVDNFLRGAN